MKVKAKLAVSTVNGRAYYKLVNELKSRGILFLSIVPGETIPSSIKVVITTESEKHLINHPQVLVYDVDSDPSGIIDEAQKIIAGKDFYEELIIGIDPGKTFGVAVLADGKTIKKEEISSIENVVNFVLTEINAPSKVKKVRIGRGIPDLAEEMARRLGRILPGNVAIEIVSEEGTSTSKEGGFKRKLSDSESAIRIASRKGERFRRDADK